MTDPTPNVELLRKTLAWAEEQAKRHCWWVRGFKAAGGHP